MGSQDWKRFLKVVATTPKTLLQPCQSDPWESLVPPHWYFPDICLSKHSKFFHFSLCFLVGTLCFSHTIHFLTSKSSPTTSYFHFRLLCPLPSFLLILNSLVPWGLSQDWLPWRSPDSSVIISTLLSQTPLFFGFVLPCICSEWLSHLFSEMENLLRGGITPQFFSLAPSASNNGWHIII